MNKPLHINFYTRKVCPLCEDAKDILLQLQKEFDLIIEEIDIYEDDHLLEQYQLMIPVVEIDGEQVDFGMIVKETLREYLNNKIDVY